MQGMGLRDVKILNTITSGILKETIKAREEFKRFLLESQQVTKGITNSESRV